MKEHSILIVEDEPIIAKEIEFILEESGVEHIAIAGNYEQAMSLIAIREVDLLLIDINLSGTRDGIDLAETVRAFHGKPFLFVTSYYDAETLRRAQQTRPFGYVLKPFVKEDIIVNVQLALFKLDQPRPIASDKFFFRDREKLIGIEPGSILFVEAFDNYSKLYHDGGKTILSHTLKSVESKLSQNGFVRIHRSYLVNFSRISMISEGYVFIENSKLPVGRAYRNILNSMISVL